MLVKWSVQQDFELVSSVLVQFATGTGRRKGNPKGVDETPLWYRRRRIEMYSCIIFKRYHWSFLNILYSRVPNITGVPNKNVPKNSKAPVPLRD